MVVHGERSFSSENSSPLVSNFSVFRNQIAGGNEGKGSVEQDGSTGRCAVGKLLSDEWGLWGKTKVRTKSVLYMPEYCRECGDCVKQHSVKLHGRTGSKVTEILAGCS